MTLAVAENLQGKCPVCRLLTPSQCSGLCFLHTNVGALRGAMRIPLRWLLRCCVDTGLFDIGALVVSAIVAVIAVAVVSVVAVVGRGHIDLILEPG